MSILNGMIVLCSFVSQSPVEHSALIYPGELVCIQPKQGHYSSRMDGLPLTAKILKSLIAPARHSDGPTLYLICAENERHVIYEQMPDGTCQAWAGTFIGGVQQAECIIYQWRSFIRERTV